MGNLATSQKTSQATTNQQVGVQGSGASGASGTISRGASQAVGGGVSLVFNTGGNKISTKGNVGNTAAKSKNKGTASGGTSTASGPPGAGHSNSASNQAGGNIAVQIQSTDQGAVQAGTGVSLAALQLATNANDALLQSTTNAFTLASHALQAGVDIAAVAIPTYAAGEIAGNAINPSPAIYDSGGGSTATASGISKTEILVAVAALVAVAFLMKGRG